MQKIKVSRVESKPTQKGGTMVALYDEKNARFSGFLKELQDVKEGDTVEAEIQIDGKYNNITAVKIVQHDAGAKSAPVMRNGAPSPEQLEVQASAEAQTAFRGATDLLAAKIINSEHPLAKAAIRWALARLETPSANVRAR